jgi:hypothetical protein
MNKRFSKDERLTRPDIALSDEDWMVLAHIRDMPLYLWEQFHGEILESVADDALVWHRPRFSLINTEVELDPRLIARLYRAWWARVLFVSEFGTTLSVFVTEHTHHWPKPRGKKNRPLTLLKAATRIEEFTQTVASAIGQQKASEYGRLRQCFTDGVISRDDLRSVDERAIGRLIEYGDTPQEFTSVLAAMVFAYMEDPLSYRGIARLLDDLYLPCFIHDGFNGPPGYDGGRSHFVVRNKPEDPILAAESEHPEPDC